LTAHPNPGNLLPRANLELQGGLDFLSVYQNLLLHKITRIEGVSGVHSSVVLRQVLERTALPVG
jgi:Lrp/AsnC family leucine-responsive transcriptional regulator